MSSKITPEMVAAWSVLQNFATVVRATTNPTAGELAVMEAINVLDNSDFMVPIERVRDGEGPTQEDRRP